MNEGYEDSDREVTAERVIVVSRLARQVEESLHAFDSTLKQIQRLHTWALCAIGLIAAGGVVAGFFLYKIYAVLTP